MVATTIPPGPQIFNPVLASIRRSVPVRMRRFPTRHEARAIELGADELHARLEWELRERPRALKNERRRYRAFCLTTFSQLERIAQSTGGRV